jgi:hypothetical protein
MVIIFFCAKALFEQSKRWSQSVLFIYHLNKKNIYFSIFSILKIYFIVTATVPQPKQVEPLNFLIKIFLEPNFHMTVMKCQSFIWLQYILLNQEQQ